MCYIRIIRSPLENSFRPQLPCLLYGRMWPILEDAVRESNHQVTVLCALYDQEVHLITSLYANSIWLWSASTLKKRVQHIYRLFLLLLDSTELPTEALGKTYKSIKGRKRTTRQQLRGGKSREVCWTTNVQFSSIHDVHYMTRGKTGLRGEERGLETNKKQGN